METQSIIAPLKVELIGLPALETQTINALYNIEKYMELDIDTLNGEGLAEFAGRSCYQSFGKPNPKTRHNEDYLAHIIELGHESVLEHANFTFYITGVSRSVTHELIRHRHLSPSQLSQRYVDANDMRVTIHPTLRDNPALVNNVVDNFYECLEEYNLIVSALETEGLKRKQAREAARDVLPNSTETRIVLTGNMRAWRDMLKQRLSPAADAAIREVAEQILAILKKEAPNMVQDSDTWFN